MTCMAFSEECPVYSKPAQPPPRPTYNPSYPGQMSNSVAASPGYPVANPGMPAPYGQRPYQQPYPSVSQNSTTPYPSSQSSSPYPVANSFQPPSQPSPPAKVTPHPPDRQGSVIDENLVRASLLSTTEDKLKRRVQEVFQMGKVFMKQNESINQYFLITRNIFLTLNVGSLMLLI